MSIGIQSPCSGCREDFRQGYNTICLNIGGEKVNLNFSDDENFEKEGDLFKRKWDCNAEWKIKKPFTPNKDLPCMRKSPPSPPTCQGDDGSTTPSRSSRTESTAWGRRAVAQVGCSATEWPMGPKERAEATPLARRAKRRGKVDKKEAIRWRYAGPPWYTALSDVQLKAVDSLALSLKLDIEEGGRKRTMKVLSEMGLTPMPTSGQIQVAMAACIMDVKALRMGAHSKAEKPARLGEWSAFDEGSDHEMQSIISDDRSVKKVEEEDEAVVGVVEYGTAVEEPWICHDSSTPPSEELTEDDYAEEETDNYLLPETRWCEWCGECNTHCAAFLPTPVCDEDDDGKGTKADDQGEEAKESEECSTRCTWCGACSEHCSANIPPMVCEEEKEDEEEEQCRKCEWCGNCAAHCPTLLLFPICEDEEEEGQQGEDQRPEEAEGEEAKGRDEEGGGAEEEGEGIEGVEDGLGDRENPEEGEEPLEGTEAVGDEVEQAEEYRPRLDSESKSRRIVIMESSSRVHDHDHEHSLRQRAMTRAPLDVIIPYNPRDPAPPPLEINVDPVEFLISLHSATGEHGGNVWESSFPQRDRLLLSSAAHLQLPQTIEWLDQVLPRRLRTDDLHICTEARETSKPRRKNRAEGEAERLKIICKRETRRHGKSPYLTYLQMAEDHARNVSSFFEKTERKIAKCRRITEMHLHRKLDNDIILMQMMEALKRVNEDFDDPIACLPFAWKLPELRLWIDQRRRKSIPLFASQRPKMTQKEIKNLLEFSKNEWNNMRVDPYQLKMPKIPAKLLKIQEFNMSHFKAARKEGEKLMRLGIQRFKRMVVEENRDYWPTMCPYANLPVPWKYRPQKPPPPPPQSNFRRVYRCYLPAREKDIAIV